MTTKTDRRAVLVTIEESAIRHDNEGKERVEWMVKLFASKFAQSMFVPDEVGQRPKGAQVAIYVVRGNRRGGAPKQKDEWNHFWNFDGLQALPPAGDTPEEPPFPVAGATKEAPVAPVKAPRAQSAPQEPASIPPVPKEAPAPPQARSYGYSRTFNLGNFESERFEVSLDAPPGWSDAEAYAHLQERIARARASLSADTSARAVERDRRTVE